MDYFMWWCCCMSRHGPNMSNPPLLLYLCKLTSGLHSLPLSFLSSFPPSFRLPPGLLARHPFLGLKPAYLIQQHRNQITIWPVSVWWCDGDLAANGAKRAELMHIGVIRWYESHNIKLRSIKIIPKNIQTRIVFGKIRMIFLKGSILTASKTNFSC